MKTLSKFKKSNFYIFFICNYWSIVSALEMLGLVALTGVLYGLFKNDCHTVFYVIQFILGIGYFVYVNIGMIRTTGIRKKIYLTMVDSIEQGKPFKKSMIYAMMMSRCESHLIKVLEKNFDIKLI